MVLLRLLPTPPVVTTLCFESRNPVPGGDACMGANFDCSRGGGHWRSSCTAAPVNSRIHHPHAACATECNHNESRASCSTLEGDVKDFWLLRKTVAPRLRAVLASNLVLACCTRLQDRGNRPVRAHTLDERLPVKKNAVQHRQRVRAKGFIDLRSRSAPCAPASAANICTNLCMRGKGGARESTLHSRHGASRARGRDVP